MSKAIHIVDTSAVLRGVWHSIPESTMPMELKTFRSNYFLKMYELILEVPEADTIIFAMDSREGYWRGEYYRKWYSREGEFQIGVQAVSNDIYLKYDHSVKEVIQIGEGVWVDKTMKIGDIPPGIVWHNWKPDAELPNSVSNEWLPFLNEVFPKYKGNRRNSKWEMQTQKKEFYKYADEVTGEIARTFKALRVYSSGAEADDIIGYVVKNRKSAETPVVITSIDMDMDQLQRYPNVVRLDPQRKEFIKVENPMLGLIAKIVIGDSGDNVKSCKMLKKTGNYSAVGMKSAKELCSLSHSDMVARIANEGWLPQFKFNNKIVNLSQTPEDINKGIVQAISKAIADRKASKEATSIYGYGIVNEEIAKMKSCAVLREIAYSLPEA